MKNRLTGEYELSNKQSDIVADIYQKHFPPKGEVGVLHSFKSNPGFTHLDIVVNPMEGETLYGTMGGSAKSSRRRPFLSEAYLLWKGGNDEDRFHADWFLNQGCTHNEELGPNYEFGLLYDYEFLFFDNGAYPEWDSLGYKGLFVKPDFTETVWDGKTLKFFRLIPAYEEELIWIEKKINPITKYNFWIKTLLDAVPERKYMNVKYPMVSFDKLK